MKITEHGALEILFPERRDPETERRRLATLARGCELFPDELLTPEQLKRGLPCRHGDSGSDVSVGPLAPAHPLGRC
ncbi:hypothetical protein ACFP9V_23085 [Deinococcus radiopugnans]|uniref:hypothetical protein n=1 Tax=Deinococcus radiopugnans TaxID=57497 RepID=UPI003613EF7A